MPPNKWRTLCCLSLRLCSPLNPCSTNPYDLVHALMQMPLKSPRWRYVNVRCWSEFVKHCYHCMITRMLLACQGSRDPTSASNVMVAAGIWQAKYILLASMPVVKHLRQHQLCYAPHAGSCNLPSKHVNNVRQVIGGAHQFTSWLQAPEEAVLAICGCSVTSGSPTWT